MTRKYIYGRVEVGSDNVPGHTCDGMFDARFVRHVFLITLYLLSFFLLET